MADPEISKVVADGILPDNNQRAINVVLPRLLQLLLIQSLHNCYHSIIVVMLHKQLAIWNYHHSTALSPTAEAFVAKKNPLLNLGKPI